MKRFLTFVAFALLPAWGWSQHHALAVRPVPLKAEMVQARYARLDNFAQHLPDAQARTLAELAASLATQARSDDDKARLIFSWLSYHVAYDVAYLKGDTTHLYTPEAVLSSHKAICQGYADLFTDLASRMKLEARTVTGHARDWLTFGNILSTANGHAWNAYRIAGIWHLADATWGAGGLSPSDTKFKQQFKPFWFDILPGQAIFYHLPTDDVWQLLPAPITAVAFQNWPYVSCDWFQFINSTSLVRSFGNPKAPMGRLPKVEARTTNSPVQLVQVPLRGELVAGRPAKFIFLIPAEVELVVEADTLSVVLKPNGRYQQATITPTTGLINVTAWHKADTTFICSLQYEVVPAPRQQKLQPGEHRKVAADSVAYLRR